jgi:hypothetical protein
MVCKQMTIECIALDALDIWEAMRNMLAVHFAGKSILIAM